MNETLTQLDTIVARHNLLRHPFYQAWSAGTLPLPALTDYARDWGAFVGTIEQGWETLGQAEYAAEERVHARLWDDFAAALGTTVAEPSIEPLARLRDTAQRLFADPATALGALYAFEAQQPATSVSKRDGLRKHYALDARAEVYFDVHADDYSEAAWLRERISQLSGGDQARCAVACEELCAALWDGLSGIYNEECATA